MLSMLSKFTVILSFQIRKNRPTHPKGLQVNSSCFWLLIAKDPLPNFYSFIHKSLCISKKTRYLPQKTMSQCFLKRLLLILIKNKKKRLTFLSRRDYSSKVITFKTGFIHLKHCKISTTIQILTQVSKFLVPYFSVLSHRYSTERFCTLMERMNQAY